jgi:hypothetical protein
VVISNKNFHLLHNQNALFVHIDGAKTNPDCFVVSKVDIFSDEVKKEAMKDKVQAAEEERPSKRRKVFDRNVASIKENNRINSEGKNLGNRISQGWVRWLRVRLVETKNRNVRHLKLHNFISYLETYAHHSLFAHQPI